MQPAAVPRSRSAPRRCRRAAARRAAGACPEEPGLVRGRSPLSLLPISSRVVAGQHCTRVDARNADGAVLHEPMVGMFLDHARGTLAARTRRWTHAGGELARRTRTSAREHERMATERPRKLIRSVARPRLRDGRRAGGAHSRPSPRRRPDDGLARQSVSVGSGGVRGGVARSRRRAGDPPRTPRAAAAGARAAAERFVAGRGTERASAPGGAQRGPVCDQAAHRRRYELADPELRPTPRGRCPRQCWTSRVCGKRSRSPRDARVHVPSAMPPMSAADTQTVVDHGRQPVRRRYRSTMTGGHVYLSSRQAE